MKIPFLLSLTALMAVAAAQSADALAEPTLDIAYTDSEIIDSPPNDMVDNDSYIDVSHSKSSKFIAWSSPGYKGHKQERKNTKGCYRLDGGAVGSYSGSNSVTYGFYKDDRCKTKLLYGWDGAPVKRIDPLIYPKSVKILDRSEHARHESTNYSLVAWSKTSFGANRQLVRGMGCQSLDGSTIKSFQGEYKYKFYADRYCYGKTTLETQGGKSTVRKMSPRSVYIY